MDRTPALLALLALAAAACSRSGAQHAAAARAALDTDPASAEASFRSACRLLSSGDPASLGARVGLCEALAAQPAPEKAREAVEAFRSLAAEEPDRVDDRLYNTLAERLAAGEHFELAAGVVRDGMERFPESSHLPGLVASLGRRAEESEDDGARKALKVLEGIGYVSRE